MPGCDRPIATPPFRRLSGTTERTRRVRISRTHSRTCTSRQDTRPSGSSLLLDTFRRMMACLGTGDKWSLTRRMSPGSSRDAPRSCQPQDCCGQPSPPGCETSQRSLLTKSTGAGDRFPIAGSSRGLKTPARLSPAGNQAWNELPQPQLLTAFGFSKVKPRFSRPSKKSTVVPSRYSALFLSITTATPCCS
jgi:hypothetical protein